MAETEKSTSELIDEALLISRQAQAGLEDVAGRLDRQGDSLRTLESLDAELEKEITEFELRQREAAGPLRGTVEFLSLGRLTIGPVQRGF